MDSFLSGFSNSHAGQVGYGSMGNVSVSGNMAASGSQGIDVTQLKPGDTFQGEIASVNGEDVQIQLAHGQYMAAKLERDVQVALGQVLNLQVQSNKDNRIVLKPVFDQNSQMLRVGEAALRAAKLAVNEKNMTLVSKLIENGMSIDKNTLMTYNRMALQNPQIDLSSIIKLNKLQLPVTAENARQLESYQGMEHKLLEGIKEASDEILRLYDTLTFSASDAGSNQAAVSDAGTRFMEQVLTLIAGDEVQEDGTPALNGQNVDAAGQNANGQEVQQNVADGGKNENVQQSTANSEQNVGSNVISESIGGESKNAGNVNNQHETQGQLKGNNADTRLNQEAANTNGEKQTPVHNTGDAENIAQTAPQSKNGNNAAQNTRLDINSAIGQLKGDKSQVIPEKIVTLIKDGKLDLKTAKQLILDSEIGKQLTTAQKSKIFNSEPFKSMLKDGLQKQWTLTPQELVKEGRVEEFYQKLMRESSQLAKLMNETAQNSGQHMDGSQTRAMGNISENIEFMNQMNQMFNYVQLPLKFGNSQAHGDLYVYTNKRNLAHKDGMLTAFLHLDMDNLGSLDVSIALQTEKNQVTTKFYLDEDSISLVKEHIDELAQRLLNKGYHCKNMVIEKDEEKTVLEHIEEQVAGGSAVLSYQTFDTRA